jgi:hypothetical protein
MLIYPVIGLFFVIINGWKEILFNSIINKEKDKGNPIDTSIVVPVRGAA